MKMIQVLRTNACEFDLGLKLVYNGLRLALKMTLFRSCVFKFVSRPDIF